MWSTRKPVEERLVAVVQGRQPYVPLQGVRFTAEVLELQGHLLFNARHPPGQQAAELERLTLAVGEGGVLVEVGPGQQQFPLRHGRLL